MTELIFHESFWREIKRSWAISVSEAGLSIEAYLNQMQPLLANSITKRKYSQRLVKNFSGSC
jgi:hypothetical protein